MIKLVSSPLFLFLAFLAVWLLLHFPRPRRFGKGSWLTVRSWATLFAGVVLFAAISTPWVAARLARTLEVYPYPTPGELAELDVITVLSGGVYRGVGPGIVELSESTYVRTSTGIRAYQASGATRLVMQGTLGGDDPGEMTRLMAEVAIARGLSEDEVIVEARSRNTREHPIELLRIEGITPQTRLGVVTSAWHLPRAMMEFERHFEHVIPIPADYISRDLQGDIDDWIPQWKGLRRSTSFFTEWVGRLWYQVRAIVARD